MNPKLALTFAFSRPSCKTDAIIAIQPLLSSVVISYCLEDTIKDFIAKEMVARTVTVGDQVAAMRFCRSPGAPAWSAGLYVHISEHPVLSDKKYWKHLPVDYRSL
jgi:hypothetical protein